MTDTLDKRAVDRPAAEQLPPPAPPPTAAPPPRPVDPVRREQARVIGGTLLVLALLVLGFVAYLFGLSRLSEQRAQNTLYKHFAHQLALALGPVGPAATGTPVAILDIPAIGVSHLVVVEGTGARQLASGPGHERDTPLPGQAGVSVVYGRRATFGGPFSNLPDLKVGDVIYVTTGQAHSRYVVRAFGTGARRALDTAANRLVLLTADSSSLPSSYVTVSADLISTVQPSAGSLPALPADENPMAGAESTSVLPLVLWGQALIIVAVVATFAVRRWSKWPAYLCFAPVALAVLWNVYENAATFLPNLW